MNGCILFLMWVTALPCFSLQDKPFSGPQPGEPLTSFKVRKALGEDAGKEVDFVKAANGKPIVLIFVHEVNRPAMAFVRTLTQYTQTRAKDGVNTGVVWLSDDVTDAENMIQRVQGALTKDVPIGISLDGREGPGIYGLNRNVSLTILVGNKDKITSNFALIQPSLQADLPKVIESVIALVGGDMPKLEQLTNPADRMRPEPRPEPGKADVPNLRPYLAPIIRLEAKPEDVDQAVKKLMEFVADNEAAKNELGRIATTIVKANKLDSYGTPRAREYIAQWAKDFGDPKNKNSDAPTDKSKPSDRK